MAFLSIQKKPPWALSTPATNNRFIEALYVSPGLESGVQSSLTVRVDQLKKNTDLVQYVHRWKKDYPRFGFDILFVKRINVNGKRVFFT